MSVRVRYAPSPTGLQHIGSARTALFNYLFARSQGGVFILRIEDTDRDRFVPEALQDIYDTYAWLGFHWDEGPDVGGPKGPYLQSERAELYRAHAEKLLALGQAYRCWCSADRLAELRKGQQAGKARDAASSSHVGYDRLCRALSPAEQIRRSASGAPHVIRLKVPLEGETEVDDRLLGHLSWKNADLSPDPVLLKSDGLPTYHLAHVVDDHLMEITDIMRAQEWLSSLPLHAILYRAFGWELPRLCHLPMVLGKDGQKLAKRHGAASVLELKRLGYLPEAVVNYLALVGWSYDDSRQLFTLAELERLFDPAKLNKAPAIFDFQKLDWFNGTYIRAKRSSELAELIRPFLAEAGCPAGTLEQASFLEGVAEITRERVKRLSEAPALVRFLFEEPADYRIQDLVTPKSDAARTARQLELLDPLVARITGDQEANERMFRGLAEELGLKLGDLMMPLRVALTGSKVSPPLFESIRLLGADRARARVARALEKLRNP